MTDRRPDALTAAGTLLRAVAVAVAVALLAVAVQSAVRHARPDDGRTVHGRSGSTGPGDAASGPAGAGHSGTGHDAPQDPDLVLFDVLAPQGPAEHVVEVPASAPAPDATGGTWPGTPRRLDVQVGDRLQLVNRSAHGTRVWVFYVPAGTTTRLRVTSAGTVVAAWGPAPDERSVVVVRRRPAGTARPAG